jgi:hypothetical protein
VPEALSSISTTGQDLATVGEIRVVCNGDLDLFDVKVAKAARDGQEALARTLVSSWQATEEGLDLCWPGSGIAGSTSFWRHAA